MSSDSVNAQGRVERKKEETKKKIIAVALDLIREQGLDGTTMEQIARKADIAKGTLYNYFPAKEAIVDEYIKRSFKENNFQRVEQLRKSPDTRSRMTMIFKELLKGVQRQKELFEKHITYRMQSFMSFKQEDSEKSGLYMLAHEIISLGQENSEIRTDMPYYILEDMFDFAFMIVVKQLYIEGESFDEDKAIGQGAELFIKAVGY